MSPEILWDEWVRQMRAKGYRISCRWTKSGEPELIRIH